MKTYNVSYNINSKSKDSYIVLADFHGNFNLSIAKKISNMTAKYVIIAGDLLNGSQWCNKNKLNKLKDFLNVIKKDKKIIICLGNHDLWGLSKEGFNNFRNLQEKNIYPLFNETCIIDNNAFTNFLPNASCFSYLKQEKIETVKKILKTYKNLDTPNKKYINHLISHNPYHFIHNEVIDSISKDYDFIYTGHFHDGWIPTKYLDKSYDSCLDKGIQEIIKHILFNNDKYSLHVMPRRNLSRGISYIYKGGYYLLLPNNKVYFYDKNNNKYLLSNKEELKERLNKQKVPALVITGAINTFKRIKIWYPYITNLKTNIENKYEGTAIIKED